MERHTDPVHGCSYYLHVQHAGGAGNGDGDVYYGRCGSDSDSERLDVWLAGGEYDERAVERDGDEQRHGAGEFHGLHDERPGCGRFWSAAAKLEHGMQSDGDFGGGSELHDQRVIHTAGEWHTDGDVAHRGQCDGEPADGGVERHGRDFVGDYCDCAGRIFDGNDGVGRDGVLRIDDYGSAGSDGDGAAGMRAVVGADHLQRDTGVGDVERRVNRSSVCDSDFLPGDHDGDGICDADRRRNWRRNWRRDWIAAGDDGFRWSIVDIPAEPARGVDVCDFVVGGVGVGGLQ